MSKSFKKVYFFFRTQSHFHLSFWIWKVCKGRGKNLKIWISWERKERLKWNKKHFSQFLKDYHLVKKLKFDKKIADTSFNYYFSEVWEILDNRWIWFQMHMAKSVFSEKVRYCTYVMKIGSFCSLPGTFFDDVTRTVVVFSVVGRINKTKGKTPSIN